jgi:hypothetical protein
LLRRRKLAIEDRRSRFVEMNLGLEFFHFTGADQRCRIRTWPRLDQGFGHARSRRCRQRRQLLHGFVGGEQRRVDTRRRPLRAASGQVQTHQEGDLFRHGALQFSASVNGAPGAAWVPTDAALE